MSDLRQAVIDRVVAALKPLVLIADRYDEARLDEHRPHWPQRDPADVELFTGRGGGRLLTLADCFEAREAVKALQP